MKFFFITLITVFVLAPSIVLAGDKYGLQATAGEAGLDTRQGSVSDVAGNVIGAGLTLIGVLFFILMIYAGITWMLARGNEEQSKKALNTITAAIIGLVLVIASYAITRFVFQSVSGETPQSSASPAGERCCVLCRRTGGSSDCTRTPIAPNADPAVVCRGEAGIEARVESIPNSQCR